MLTKCIQISTNYWDRMVGFSFDQDAYHPEDTETHTLGSMPSFAFIQKDQIRIEL